MSPLVEEALKSLTTSCNISALHVRDEDQVKLTLKALHKHGEILDPTEIESWVLANNWQPKPAKSITTWAKKIASKGRVQLKNKSFLKKEKEIINQFQQNLTTE